MQVVFLTGITGGLGSAIAEVFLKQGHRVYGTSQDMMCKEEQVKTLENIGAHIYQLDIRDHKDCQRVVQKVIDAEGRIDVLVNNAGRTSDRTLKKMSKENWSDVIDVNLTGTFNVTHSVLPHMLEKEYGRIISISSVNGVKGQFGQSNYSASKSGLYGFSKSLALEVASKGITVNTVSPGYLATEMTEKMPSDVLSSIVKSIPVGRLGRPTEVAELVSFLSSDKSGFITSSDFSINGGQY